MGYIKKLKNNELVGGTDKTTVYPVTSTKAIFEEVSDNEFKSQKYLNNHITNERIVDNTIENSKLKDDTIDMGKLNTQLKTIIQNAYDASWKVKEEPFSLETKYDANDVVYDPATNSSYVSLTADNQGNPVNPEDEGYVEGKWRVIINGISAVESTEVIDAKVTELETKVDDKIEELDTEVDNKINDAQEQLDAKIADVQVQLNAVTKEATDAAIEARDAASTVETLTSQQVADAQVGYFECTDTAASGAAANETKLTTTDTIGESHYIKTVGSHVKIKMAAANTHAAPVYLQFGNQTNTKAPLLYNGEPVSASNTWEEGEVISVYFDGTNYQASNSQGGSNKKIDAYLLGDLRTLAVGQTYEDNESVQTIDKQLLKMPRPVTEMNLTDEIVAGDLRVYSGGTYKASKNVRTYTGNDSSYNEGDYAIGSYSEYTITVTAGNSAGNIIVNNESIEITDGETAAEIAASIVENIIIDGWTLSSEDDTVTVKCRTIGSNTTSITFDDGDTGVTLSGISTPSSTGTDVLRVYASGSWSNAVLSDYAASSVWGEGALTLAQLQEEAVQNHVPKLYDDYGQNKDGAISQKALNDIADERDEVVMRALLDLDERSGGGGSAGNALNYTKKNFYVFGASIEAIARAGNPGKTAASLIPTNPTGWVTYFKQAPYVKEVYIYAAAAGAYATCTRSATFTLDYDTGNQARNIYWNQFNLAIYNYLKGTVPAPDVIIISTGGNDIQWQSNRDFQTIFSETADDVFGTNLNAFTFTKYADADILSENISSAEVSTKCLTFASCWRYYVEMIYSYWPDTQIIFYGNGYTRGGDIPRNEVENTFNRQNDLTEACCRKMGLPIIRGDYEGGRWNVYEMVKHIAAGGSPDDNYSEGKNHPWGWTYDGYHTTSEGAKMLGEYMISKVGSLLRYRYNV